jgi:citrate synthase
VANWREVAGTAKGRIYRPRQIYTGSLKRSYVPIEERQ